jgi:hypothetical protein
MSVQIRYRRLTRQETESLLRDNCRCDDWSRVKVTDNFVSGRCINVFFSGDIFLDGFTENYIDEAGVSHPCGIFNTRLHNCKVGANAMISNTGDYIANYDIEPEVVIKNCGKISTEGKTSFGNGQSIAVLNETGGRAVKMWDRLSAHEAYIIALYRHRSKAVDIIEGMVDDYSATVTSDRGTIGHHSRLISCNMIRNVRFSPYSHAEGSMTLNEGSVNSCKEDPVFIGPGVIMEHFIMCSGSVVSESTLIDKCFIGQGCVLSKHYSAENSLFFANCGGYHGEACSIFAGPYTVTHHKSTLLIAGIFSFMNAGSGSNQSNHMYKLGPIHQGIMERGSKTTSDSYLLWPARIGPYTLVMGRHYKNMDTSSVPFSYLIESNDESILVPGINLRSVGTIRDAQKWPVRDKRKDPFRIDQVNFNLLSPYTIRKMMEGRELLKRIRDASPGGSSYYYYNSMKIAGNALERGIELYQMGIDKFLGNSIIKRLEGTKFKNNDELRDRLKPGHSIGKGEWIDLAGLITPKSETDRLLDDVEAGKIKTIDELRESFVAMQKMYYDWEWTWACERIEEETGRAVDLLTAGDVVSIVEKWKKSVVDLDNMLYSDARKEFTLSSMTGFGIDGGEDIKRQDFGQVRGEFESNPVVKAIKEHIEVKTTLGNELIERIRDIS